MKFIVIFSIVALSGTFVLAEEQQSEITSCLKKDSISCLQMIVSYCYLYFLNLILFLISILKILPKIINIFRTNRAVQLSLCTIDQILLTRISYFAGFPKSQRVL